MSECRFIPGALLAAVVGILPACSSTQPKAADMSNDIISVRERSGQPRVMTFKSNFPPPAAILLGTFGVRNGCLALQIEGSPDWLIAVVPPGSVTSEDAVGRADGVTIGGTDAHFGTKVRFGGGVSPYDLGSAGQMCPGPTVIVGSLIS